MPVIEDMTRFEPIEPCLYFLLDGGQVVYVGQTRSFHLRMYQHKNGEASTPAKVFNSVRYEVMDRNELDKAEAWHMLQHMPKYNRQLKLKGQLNMLKKLAAQYQG
jgi:predicted GIY-YIG superfamily endonuclease